MFLYDDGETSFKVFLHMQPLCGVVLAHDTFAQSFAFPASDFGTIIKCCANPEQIEQYADSYTDREVDYKELFAIFSKLGYERKITTEKETLLKKHFKDVLWGMTGVRNQLIILDCSELIKEIPSSKHPMLVKSCEYMKKFADELPTYLQEQRKEDYASSR